MHGTRLKRAGEGEGSLGDRGGRAGLQAPILAEGSGNCAAGIWRGRLGNGSCKGIVRGGDFSPPGNDLKRWGLAKIP